ncbi:YheT family hydrolase [Mesoterricola silvestris]|uniref:Hydrolase n=1 Tax=Mesoterricola silvestris TaxID=2927979 RepID=A0AA48K900_9BACT|nr:alpha/beta fold hydrolase [Mesoterricola silvestris]BDU71812.1 hydrolase [Mesoterricola silvestris]
MNLARPPLACVPPPWARGAHLQTLAAQYLPNPLPDLPWQPLRLDLGDGDALALRALDGTTGVAVHLFHGLGGSVEGHYMRRLAARLHAQGHAVLAANHRGAGEGAGLARHTYHSGATADMAAVLRLGRQRFPGQLQVAVGFSISANILLLLAGRDRHLDLPDRAIAVNPPADLEACSQRLGVGFNRVYDQYFLQRLRREVQGRPGGEAARATRTLRAFDAAYTAPQAGFPTREAYYALCSCGPHLAGIQVPTVILTSRDDPFAPASDLLVRPVPPSVHLHVEATGGHMGYITRNLPDRRWLDYAVTHYLAALAAFRP